mgnify:CR=1 FL=1
MLIFSVKMSHFFFSTINVIVLLNKFESNKTRLRMGVPVEFCFKFVKKHEKNTKNYINMKIVSKNQFWIFHGTMLLKKLKNQMPHQV